MRSSLLANQAISRRGFLVRTAGLSSLLLIGGCRGDGEQDYGASLAPGESPENLPLREYVVLASVARRLVPGGPDHPGAGELGVARRLDRELVHHPGKLRSDLCDALRLVEWWPLATRFTAFTRLAAEQQDAELAGMAASRWAPRRSAFQGLRFLVMFMHYSQEPAWVGIGYDGPWVPRGPADAPVLG